MVGQCRARVSRVVEGKRAIMQMLKQTASLIICATSKVGNLAIFVQMQHFSNNEC